MTKIHVLDDNTINKIAAGEVVERPASVIKELIENAMDAGATRIEVEIMAGGTSFMRVTDNGKGMSKEDASVAILRHATSKIQEVSDLNSISTMGVRGYDGLALCEQPERQAARARCNDHDPARGYE